MIVDGWEVKNQKRKVLRWNTLQVSVDWWKAVETVAQIGDDWRLPTGEEIHEYYEGGIDPDEKDRSFWTGGYGGYPDNIAECFSFKDGCLYACEKNSPMYIKIVKEVFYDN